MARNVRRLIVLAVSFLLVLGACRAESFASLPPIPLSSPTVSDDFVIPVGATPSPIRDKNSISSCTGSACNGTDPHETGCDLPVNGSYTQDTEQVFDERGNLLGTLSLRANHTGCDSTQWALFSGLTRPLTFELRVVQNHTGLSTETVRMEDWREDTWTTQLHSPNQRVRAEVVVYDSSGRVIASAVTASY